MSRLADEPSVAGGTITLGTCGYRWHASAHSDPILKRVCPSQECDVALIVLDVPKLLNRVCPSASLAAADAVSWEQQLVQSVSWEQQLVQSSTRHGATPMLLFNLKGRGAPQDRVVVDAVRSGRVGWGRVGSGRVFMIFHYM